MTLPHRLLPLVLLALVSCSAEDRAKRRVQQIEAELDAKAEAGTLTADEFAQAMDEMVELTEPVREQRRREEAARLELQRRELVERRERQAREREEQQEQARIAAAARLEEIRPEAIAAVQAAAARYDELLNTLRALANAQPSGARRLVEHEIENQERYRNRDLQQLQNLLDNSDNLRSVEAAFNEANSKADYVQLAIDRANARLSALPGSGGAEAPAPNPAPARPPQAVSPTNATSISEAPDPAPAPPTIEEIRADATNAMNEIETLHDELIRLLEARAAAAGNEMAKKQATNAVTLAQLAKRQDMDRLRADIAAEERWRIEGAIRHAATAQNQLKAQITAAREQH